MSRLFAIMRYARDHGFEPYIDGDRCALMVKGVGA